MGNTNRYRIRRTVQEAMLKSSDSLGASQQWLTFVFVQKLAFSRIILCDSVSERRESCKSDRDFMLSILCGRKAQLSASEVTRVAAVYLPPLEITRGPDALPRSRRRARGVRNAFAAPVLLLNGHCIAFPACISIPCPCAATASSELHSLLPRVICCPIFIFYHQIIPD